MHNFIGEFNVSMLLTSTESSNGDTAQVVSLISCYVATVSYRTDSRDGTSLTLQKNYGSGYINFTLLLEPTADVTVFFASDSLTTVVPSLLLFPLATWSAAQAVLVAAVENDIVSCSVPERAA